MSSKSESSRGRPHLVSRRTILEVATRIPKDEFSLRKLAEMLNVSPQSLYHYFPNKKSIFDAIAKEIVTSVPVVKRELVWREYLREAIRGYRKWLLGTNFQVKHTAEPMEKLDIFRVAGHRSPELLERFDDFIFVFRRDGFELSGAVEIWILFQKLLRRLDLHHAPNDGMRAAWENLLVDISASESGEFTELEDLIGLEMVKVDDLHEALIEVFLEGIAARYGVS